MGIGLLVVTPVVYFLRHEIAANARKLFSSTAFEEGFWGRTDTDAHDDKPDGISFFAAMIGGGAAAISFLWGVVSGNLIFVISGAVTAIAVVSAFVIDGKRRS